MKHKKLREKFKWGQVFDKNMKKLDKPIFRYLKDISDSHLIGIIVYFTKKLKKLSKIYEDNNMNFLPVEIKMWSKKHLIFCNELKYRQENNIKIEDYDN